jgi:biotin carboxylase
MTTPTDLPRLAVVFDAISAPPMRISAAAAGTWHTLWLVDTSIAGYDHSARLLPRVGTVIDITGLSPTQAAAELAKHSPDGIMALAESELHRAAFIAAELDLLFHSPEVVDRLVSKVDQRAALQAAGIWVPGYHPVPPNASKHEIAAALDAVRLPAILKPQAGSGSRNTYKVTTKAELETAISEIGASFEDVSRDFILEEILTDSWPRNARPYADYASIETIAESGKLHHVATTGRTPLAEPFRESGFFTPSNLPAPLLRLLEQITADAILAMSPGVSPTGAFHTEIKLTAEGPRVIEVNGRPGGIWIPEIVEMVGGPSILTLAGRAALGLPWVLDAESTPRGVGYELQYQQPINATKLTKIEGSQDVARLPGVHTLTLSKQAGARLDWREGTTGSLFTVVGVVEDHEALWRFRERIDELIIADYEFPTE